MKKTIVIDIDRNGWQVSDPRYKSYNRAVISDGGIMNKLPEMSGCSVVNTRKEALECIAEAVKQYIMHDFKDNY
jgi:hypothetical protein